MTHGLTSLLFTQGCLIRPAAAFETLKWKRETGSCAPPRDHMAFQLVGLSNRAWSGSLCHHHRRAGKGSPPALQSPCGQLPGWTFLFTLVVESGHRCVSVPSHWKTKRLRNKCPLQYRLSSKHQAPALCQAQCETRRCNKKQKQAYITIPTSQKRGLGALRKNLSDLPR